MVFFDFKFLIDIRERIVLLFDPLTTESHSFDNQHIKTKDDHYF